MYTFKPFVFIKHHVVGPEKPKARSGHRVVCDERNLFSYGGFNPSITSNDPDMRNDQNWSISRPLFKEIWKFNFVTKSWKRLPCQKVMPNELASNAIVLKGVILIIHGGTGVPFGDNCNNNVYLYNVNDGEMKIVPAEGELPSPQYGQAIICHGPYLYTVGGTTGIEYTCDIHRLNMQTQVWESVYICGGRDQCEPKGRYRHEIAFDGRIIYVLGGGTASEAFNLEVCYHIVDKHFHNTKRIQYYWLILLLTTFSL
jgi:hypothetical protein